MYESGTFSSLFRRSSAVTCESTGDGRYASTPSSSAWMPVFLSAEPTMTGTNSLLSVRLRIALTRSSSVGSSSMRNFSPISSSTCVCVCVCVLLLFMM